MSRWPTVSLGDVLEERKERVGTVDADGLPLLGVSNREGLHRSDFVRIPDMSRYQRVRRGWFAYNPMRINVGSVGWASKEDLAGVISPDYVVFSCTPRVEPQLVYLFLKSRLGLQAINAETAGSVRDRLYFSSLARVRMPFPPLEEQRRIVTNVDGIAERSAQLASLRAAGESDLRNLLLAAYRSIARDAPRRRMAEVAPLVRRPVSLDKTLSYPELGVRSFGRGTFHKPLLPGSEVGTKKLFRIEPGDLVFNIVFAWEGAVAVARPEDLGRFGSHRFLTCVPMSGIASVRYLCFHFLTDDGLADLGVASPGGAGRNRTLGIQALGNLSVPLPDCRQQLWFGDLLARVTAIQIAAQENEARLSAIMPAVVDRAFYGGL